MSMRCLSTALLVLAAGALAGPAAGAPRFTKQELAVPGGILWLTTGDLDGDRLTDLILSYRRGSGSRAQRFLAVFFRRPTGFTKDPDVTMAAPRSAAVFDVGEALGDGREQIVYLAADGVYAQSFVDRRPGNPARILTVASLVSEPEEDDLATWDFLRPMGPGGPATLIIPTRGPLRLFRAEAGAVWKPWSRLSIAQLSTYDAELSTFRRDRRGGASGRPYAFRSTTVVPVIDLADQTGDGKIDVITSLEDELAVYPALEDGTISAKPVFAAELGVRTQEELETRDASVSSAIVDLDGDGIADAVISKISGGITTLGTKTYLFRGVKGGGFEPKPAQVFEDEGFAALAQFVDADGDGRLEMVHPHAPVSIVGISQMMLSKELTLGVRIRRPAAERPAFFEKGATQTIDTVFGLDLSVGATLRGIFPIFGHDFDGDGRRDAVLSEGGAKMVLYRGVEGEEPFDTGGAISLSAPGASTTIPLYPDVARKGRPDVLTYFVDRPELAGRLILFRNDAGTEKP